MARPIYVIDLCQNELSLNALEVVPITKTHILLVPSKAKYNDCDYHVDDCSDPTHTKSLFLLSSEL